MKKVSDLLPPVDENQSPHGLTLEKVYRSYKNSPHNPDATYGKYLVHRLENADKYNTATPEQQETMDRKFLDLHQKGDAAKKNGHITTQHLKNFITSKDTQKLAGQMLRHKQSLKNMILKEHPEHIVNINGQPHIRLTRGLSVDRNQRGAEHALASYADIPNPPFGGKWPFFHHQLVPLNNIWFSYDYGPKEATSPEINLGNEDEFLVSPHENIYNEDSDNNPTKPIAYRNWHSHKRRTNDSFLKFLEQRHQNGKGATDGFYESAPDDMLLHAIKKSKDNNALSSVISNRIAGLKNKKISENIQRALLDIGHDDAKSALAEHPHLAPSLQDELYNSGNTDAITGLVKRKDLHSHLQEKMANEPQHPAVYNHLAEREDLLPHLQDKLFQRAFRGYLTIHRILAKRNNLQPHLQEKLLDTDDPQIDNILAGRDDLLPHLQERLLNTDSPAVNRRLAKRLDLLPHLQDKLLSTDDKETLMNFLEANQSRPTPLKPHQIDHIIKSVPHVAYRYLENEMTPERVLATKVYGLPKFAAQHFKDKLTPEHIDYIVQNAPSVAAEHLADKLQPHHIDYIVEKRPLDAIAFLRDSLQSHNIDYLVQDPLRHHLLAKLLKHKLTPEHIDYIVQKVPGSAAQHFKDKLQPHHIDHIVEKSPISAAKHLADKLQPHHIDHIVQNAPDVAAEDLAHLLQPHHVDHIVDREPEHAMTLLPKLLQQHHIDKLVERHPRTAAEALAKHPLLQSHHIDHIIKTNPAYVAAYLKDKLQPHHIDHIVQKDPWSAAQHLKDKLTPEHIDYIAQKEPQTAASYLSNHPYYQQKYLKKSEESQLIRSWLAKNIPQLTGNSGEFDSLLSKATRPQDFKSIVRALDKEGSNYVDHKPHLEEHPPEHSDLVSNYRNEVIGSPNVYKRTRLSKKGEKGGITKKVIFATKDTKPQPESFGNFVPESKWMVKPYNERVINRVKNWQKFPIQGWAEMAHQALYHAAGIGDLHQKAHVSEHNMGDMNKNEPALVIHMENGYEPISEYSDFMDVPEEHEHKALKIGLMDFLTNNLDRHHGNLLIKASDAWQPAEQEYKTPLIGDNDNGNLLNEFAQQFQNDSDFDDIKVQNPEPRKSIFTPPKVEDIKAIDHSRSFQYINNHDLKWEGRRVVKNKTRSAEGLQDFFRHYIWGSGTSIADVAPQRPKNYDQQLNFLEKHGKPLFSWWGEVGPKVRETMYKHLNYVKNPEVRAHIKRNFDARADWLDERAKFGVENFGVDWYSDPVSQYHPNQKTDEELEQERIAEARAKWAQENK